MNFLLKITISIVFALSPFFLKGSNGIVYENSNELLNISSKLLIFHDSLKELKINDVIDKQFTPTNTSVPNLGISSSHFWVKVPITNNSNQEKLVLELSLPIINHIEFYSSTQSNNYDLKITGDEYSFNQRPYKDPYYLFDVNIAQGETKTFYLKVWSNEAIQLPMKLGKKEMIFDQIKIRDLLSGIYTGIMLVMILYNLFIYFSVRDKSYLYYVIYILFILLTQTSLQGYTFQYLWPNTSIITKYSLIFLPSLSGITGMYFMNVFLKTKDYSIRIYRASFILMVPYLIAFILSFNNMLPESQGLIQLNSGIISLYMLLVPIYVFKKGFKPAKYFIAAWSTFLVGVVIFILKDADALPFNNFTRYTMQIGSAIETILLSLALASRINTYKKERLEALEEKEKIVREQNVVLEQQVKERTSELNKTLNNLKETQSQLVDAEKMSSLGQLTAGIAHEINNPINFVSSNISPLRQDLDDIYAIINKYEELNPNEDLEEKLAEIESLKNELDFKYLKTEIPQIINGIEDGANRTKEIVSGLRNFSRLDEAELQMTNINEGIESTLILIKSKFHDITLEKDLTNLPSIECYPSKLNQLFMNIIDNAIDAVSDKIYEDDSPKIIIRSFYKNDNISFSVQDNGIGMSEQTKEKIFEPFFTTKDVGKGTGLGLAIVYGILEQHNGKINIETALNIGSTINIQIPINK